MKSESRSLAGELAELRRKFLELEERYAKITARSEQYDDSSENPDQEFFTEVADSSVLATGARSGFRDKNTECNVPSNRSTHNNRGMSNAREKNDEFRGAIRERDGLHNKASGERRNTNSKPQSHSNVDKNSSVVKTPTLPIDSELTLTDDLTLVDDPTSNYENIINEKEGLSHLDDELFLLQCEDDGISYRNNDKSVLNQDNLSNNYQTSPCSSTANKSDVAKENANTHRNANTIGRMICEIFRSIAFKNSKNVLHKLSTIAYHIGYYMFILSSLALFLFLLWKILFGIFIVVYFHYRLIISIFNDLRK